MDREINIDSIRALEGQIKDHERAVIRLKRVRNSLLNVSRLPPEVLSKIFLRNVAPKSAFDGLDEGSHNFLLVCHHWFEVASGTPDLWSFWGNTPKDWARRYHLSGTTSLDLVLNDVGHEHEDYFDATLRNALQDRAARDTIRRIHLMAEDPEFLSSVIASLTADCEEPQSNGMVSVILWSQNATPVDVSDFFSHYRFPKLQRLCLTNCTITSWDYLMSRTSALTALRLDFRHPSPTPTTSQLLSILSSNPSLQRLSLVKCAIPDSFGHESSTRVQLHHLKELRLEGDLPHVFRLLDHLDHPRCMDRLSLTLYNSDIADISQTTGPYLRDYLRRRDGHQDRLCLRVSSGNPTGYRGGHIDFQAGDAGELDLSAPEWERVGVFIAIVMLFKWTPHKNAIEKAALDLTTYAPLEEVVYLHTHNNTAAMEDLNVRFQNLKTLTFHMVPLDTAFRNPNMIADRYTFPSLENISLGCVDVDTCGWSPLKTFLACRVSSGNRLDTLQITDSPHMCQELMEDIRGMVRELKVHRPHSVWLFGTCPTIPD